jgi:hypothetical protein
MEILPSLRCMKMRLLLRMTKGKKRVGFLFISPISELPSLTRSSNFIKAIKRLSKMSLISFNVSCQLFSIGNFSVTKKLTMQREPSIT